MSESWGSWSEVDAQSANAEKATTETTAPIVKPAQVAKQAKPVATPKSKAKAAAAATPGTAPVTISITFSAADHQRVMKKLDGRPARSKLAEIIIESMFGAKE